MTDPTTVQNLDDANEKAEQLLVTLQEVNKEAWGVVNALKAITEAAEEVPADTGWLLDISKEAWDAAHALKAVTEAHEEAS